MILYSDMIITFLINTMINPVNHVNPVKKTNPTSPQLFLLQLARLILGADLCRYIMLLIMA
jgi:hypothetical protein